MRHHLFGHLPRQPRLDPALFVDRGQFARFGQRRTDQLRRLARQIGLLGIGLRTDRDIFPAAIDSAPPTRAAIPATSTAPAVAPGAAATPTIRLETEMMPSLAPSTAARSQPVR
ncbi:hypothetical protein GCM10020258_23840 [Sphingomonas yabuuchiae]